jgi:hypothetical protein
MIIIGSAPDWMRRPRNTRQAIQVRGELKLEHSGIHPAFRAAGGPQARLAARV